MLFIEGFMCGVLAALALGGVYIVIAFMAWMASGSH